MHRKLHSWLHDALAGIPKSDLWWVMWSKPWSLCQTSRTWPAPPTISRRHKQTELDQAQALIQEMSLERKDRSQGMDNNHHQEAFRFQMVLMLLHTVINFLRIRQIQMANHRIGFCSGLFLPFFSSTLYEYILLCLQFMLGWLSRE